MKKWMLKRAGTWFVLIVFLFTTVFSMTSFMLEAQAATGDDGGGGDVDTSIFKPNLQVALTGYNVVEAGKVDTIHIDITNTSKTADARNIVFLPPNYSKESSPFISSKMTPVTPIDRIAKGETVSATISVEVDKFAVEGIYSYTFNLQYDNSWNTAGKNDTYKVDIKVANSKRDADLKINISEGKSVSGVSGGTFELPLTIRNEGSFAAKEVKVSLPEELNKDFMISSGNGRYDFSAIYGNEAYEMTYIIKAASSLKSGSYPLKLKIEYLDEKDGKPKGTTQEVWIPVAGTEAGTSVLEVLEIKPSKTSVKPGESFDVTVKVKNSGDYATKQVKVSAEVGAGLMPVSQNLFIIPNLQKGETKTMVFKYQPQPDAARGSVPITIKVDSGEGEDKTSIAQAISVFIDSTSDGKPEAGKNVPKIIVKSYSSEPTLVKAGENFVLNMEFLNTHASKTVKNIKGNFIVQEGSDKTGNVFSPVDSSNTFFIDEIAPKGTTDWTLTLYTIPDAKSKTYTVTISFEYEDSEGNPYKGEELIGIPVYQPSRFEVSEFSLPPETFMGQPVFVGFEMYNMGKTDIYNVKLNVEGDFEAQPKSNYFGNFESGRTEYFEINLVPMMVGQANGKIVFQYENASGEKQELIKEISMNVMEMQMPPEGEIPVDGKPMPGTEEPQNKGFFGSVWFYVILGVVVVGVIVTVVLVVRKRKKDKESDF